MHAPAVPDKQSLENTQRVINNLSFLLKEGNFKGEWHQGLIEAQGFVGNLLNQVTKDLEAINAAEPAKDAEPKAAVTPEQPSGRGNNRKSGGGKAKR